MSSQHSARTTFTGSYHEQSQLPSSELDPPEGVKWDLLQVMQTAAVNGFQTLFHTALALAQRDDEASKRQLMRFAETVAWQSLLGWRVGKTSRMRWGRLRAVRSSMKRSARCLRRSIKLSGR